MPENLRFLVVGIFALLMSGYGFWTAAIWLKKKLWVSFIISLPSLYLLVYALVYFSVVAGINKSTNYATILQPWFMVQLFGILLIFAFLHKLAGKWKKGE